MSGPVGAAQFRVFRIALGLYLAVHFAQLMPWAQELFSHRGVFPDGGVLPLSFAPGLFSLSDSPAFVRAVLVGLTVASLAFAAGWRRRPLALVLWFGWASLFLRNPLIANPSIPYVGLLLLVTALVPVGEGRLRAASARDSWALPFAAYRVVLIALVVGYSYSGIDKLGAPSWRDGTALSHLLENPLARPGPLRELLLGLPRGILLLLTWSALAIEIAAAPLSLHPLGRAAAWFLLTGLQLGILTVVAFADLTAGMLLAHLFVFDPAWLARLRTLRSAPAG